jgi:hypothetical protein
MTLKEAIQKYKQNKHLVGHRIKTQEVSHIAIIPSNGKDLEKIISRLHLEKSYGDILIKHSKFDIVVIYDLFTSDTFIFQELLDSFLSKNE